MTPNRARLVPVVAAPSSRTELVPALAAGTEGSMERLFDVYGGIAYSLAFRILGDPAEAQDVVQDAFLSAWRAAPTYDPTRGSERAWLLRIVRNRALHLVRHAGSRPLARPLDDARGVAAEVDTSELAIRNLQAAEVREVLRAVPPEQLRAIRLAYFDGLTHVEVADRLNLPLGTVKGRLRLALIKLRGALEAAASRSMEASAANGPAQQRVAASGPGRARFPA